MSLSERGQVKRTLVKDESRASSQQQRGHAVSDLQQSKQSQGYLPFHSSGMHKPCGLTEVLNLGLPEGFRGQSKQVEKAAELLGFPLLLFVCLFEFIIYTAIKTVCHN